MSGQVVDPGFGWWDDALVVAQRRAHLAGQRWRVFRDGSLWRIRQVGIR